MLALLLGLALFTAACGDDDDTTSGDDDTETPDDGDTGETPDASGDAAVTLDDRCAEAKDAGVEAPDGFTVRLITDIGKVDDRTFNQFAYEGMQAAADCFGFDTSFIETASEADYATNIATSLEGGPDAIVTVGFLLATDTLAAAEANPDVSFIGVDQFQPEFPDNYVGVQFREDEGGCLAGVAAGLLTESNVIGVVGGREDVPPVVRYVNAYESCAKQANPDVQVLSTYNESFNDPAKGASDAQQFLGEGADVIFGAGGPTGSAGVVEATKAGVWGIGVDQDEYFSTFDGGSAEGADKLATSAIKRVDLSVFDNIVNLLTGDFAGGFFTLTAENAGITYAPSHDADVPQDVLDALEETRVALAEGTYEIGVDPITGLPE
ncbi:BMP family ABC transporter substrate-binding protein [Actinospongicola halichondriae]|uniref:BMP family ABC transporter substrate-binding protein n=1 Tax=Actinospongicola halichondriae TaxID=3236844 RepID=UPI003D4933CD